MRRELLWEVVVRGFPSWMRESIQQLEPNKKPSNTYSLLQNNFAAIKYLLLFNYYYSWCRTISILFGHLPATSVLNIQVLANVRCASRNQANESSQTCSPGFRADWYTKTEESLPKLRKRSHFGTWYVKLLYQKKYKQERWRVASLTWNWLLMTNFKYWKVWVWYGQVLLCSWQYVLEARSWSVWESRPSSF